MKAKIIDQDSDSMTIKIDKIVAGKLFDTPTCVINGEIEFLPVIRNADVVESHICILRHFLKSIGVQLK